MNKVLVDDFLMQLLNGFILEKGIVQRLQDLTPRQLLELYQDWCELKGA